MIAKIRHLRYLKTSNRCFTTLENIAFPYKFGNTKSKLTLTSEEQKRTEAILSANTDIREGIKLAYRAILNCLKDEDFDSLKNMLEGNLYTKFKTQYDYLKNKGYSLKLYNENSDIDVRAKFLGIIIGGSIDRKEEEGARASETSLFGIKMLAIIKDGSKELAASQIMKLTAELKTSCKLGLVEPGGRSSVSNVDEEEVHELTLEGITISIELKNLKFNLLTKLLGEVRKGLNFDNATAVDFDNVLNGNKHKGSSYL